MLRNGTRVGGDKQPAQPARNAVALKDSPVYQVWAHDLADDVDDADDADTSTVDPTARFAEESHHPWVTGFSWAAKVKCGRNKFL